VIHLPADAGSILDFFRKITFFLLVSAIHFVWADNAKRGILLSYLSFLPGRKIRKHQAGFIWILYQGDCNAKYL